jgi:transposase
MVVVGADVHKRTHTFVAVDEVGRKLAEKVVTATTTGINALATRIGERVRDAAPVLLALPGCGELTAAKLVICPAIN